MSGSTGRENMALSLVKQGWFQIGLVGIILFIIVDLFLRHTESANFLPAYLVLGVFTIPVAFAAYFYRQEHLLDRAAHGGIPLVQVSLLFLAGGIVGSVIAGAVATLGVFNSNLANYVKISAIEEAAKMIFPVVVFLLARYRSEADGIVFGIATGVGFAALETLGYIAVLLISLNTAIGDLEQVLITQGLLGPIGQGAWTGLICAAIWHYRGQGLKLVLIALAYFILAVVFHSLWIWAASTNENLIRYPIQVAISALSLGLVLFHLHHARQKTSIDHAKSPETA